MRDKEGRGEEELAGDWANVGGRGEPSPSQHQPQLLFIEHWSPLSKHLLGTFCVPGTMLGWMVGTPAASR